MPARSRTRKFERGEIQLLPSTARHNHVDVRMVRQRRIPRMVYGGDADSGAESLRIGRDGECGLSRGLHKQIIDHTLVVIGHIA